MLYWHKQHLVHSQACATSEHPADPQPGTAEDKKLSALISKKTHRCVVALGVGEGRAMLGKRTPRSGETPPQSAQGLMNETCIQTEKWDLPGQSQGSAHALQQAGSPEHLFCIFRYLIRYTSLFSCLPQPLMRSTTCSTSL